jgi:hypothetical protein
MRCATLKNLFLRFLRFEPCTVFRPASSRRKFYKRPVSGIGSRALRSILQIRRHICPTVYSVRTFGRTVGAPLGDCLKALSKCTATKNGPSQHTEILLPRDGIRTHRNPTCHDFSLFPRFWTVSLRLPWAPTTGAPTSQSLLAMPLRKLGGRIRSRIYEILFLSKSRIWASVGTCGLRNK